MTNDPMTGLPALPPNQFWRIKADKGSTLIWIELHENRRFLGFKVGSKYLYMTYLRDENDRPNFRNEPIDPRKARHAAELLLVEHQEEMEERRRTAEAHAANKKIYGDYPPKRLEIK